MDVTRTTMYLSTEDRAALLRLQERLGLSTMSDAIRYAVRFCEAFHAENLLLREENQSLARELAYHTQETQALQDELAATVQELGIMNGDMVARMAEGRDAEGQRQRQDILQARHAAQELRAWAQQIRARAQVQKERCTAILTRVTQTLLTVAPHKAG